MIEDVKIEFGNLERLNKEMKDLLAKFAETPDFVERRAAASILHDFYSGVEKIFERIAPSTIDTNCCQHVNHFAPLSAPVSITAL